MLTCHEKMTLEPIIIKKRRIACDKSQICHKVTKSAASPTGKDRLIEKYPSANTQHMQIRAAPLDFGALEKAYVSFNECDCKIKTFPYEKAYLLDSVTMNLEKEREQQERYDPSYIEKTVIIGGKDVSKNLTTTRARFLVLHWICWAIASANPTHTHDNNYYFRAVKLYDAYCSTVAHPYKTVSHHPGHLHLVASACLSLAMMLECERMDKYLYGPQKTIGKLHDPGVDVPTILMMERNVSKRIDYQLYMVSEFDFLDLFVCFHVHKTNTPDEEAQDAKAGTMLCLYYMQLEPMFNKHLPSIKVMAALAYALIKLGTGPVDSELFEWYNESTRSLDAREKTLACMDELHKEYKRILKLDLREEDTVINELEYTFKAGMPRVKERMSQATNDNLYHTGKRQLRTQSIH